ncbi:MAG: hypothetical protein HY549_12295 [Elusimicrobia bacterium]|nr:hypothetical protein [Elusimicrobiota bacterium]
MSFKGKIETRCPHGCDPFTAEIWSFIRADKSPELRFSVAWLECNLLLCPHCDRPFFPSAPYIYFDPPEELLAFVFPDDYRDQEQYWRGKMSEDFAALKKAFGEKMPLSVEPQVFFGPEGLSELLKRDNFRAEERDVMEHVASELGLSLYRVSRAYARTHDVPATLPYVPSSNGKFPTARSVIAGLERLLSENDSLAGYQNYLRTLKASSEAKLPPPAPVS